MSDRHALTRGGIYISAIHHYEQIFPSRKGLETIASIIGVHEKKLYRALRDEAELSASEEERLFVTCCFPQGFELKKAMLFPQMLQRTA